MRKKNSDFQTGFLSEVGTLSYDKGHFAYVELDEYACWIAAESMDSCANKGSAKLAVNQIIQDFMAKPTMAKAKIKEYLNNAHQKLKDESKNEMLKVGLVMMITDYSKFCWAVSGNVRLYHFRDGKFGFRSKDQTIAQLMVDSGTLCEEAVNSREERNNIINYLGGSTEFKSAISENFRLQDGDVMLLCNSGFWECFTPEQLAAVIKESEKPDVLVKKLQKARAELAVNEAKNSLLGAIVVAKAFKENAAVLQEISQKILMNPIRKVLTKHDIEKVTHYRKLFQKAAWVIVSVLVVAVATIIINQQVAAFKLQKELEAQKKLQQQQRKSVEQFERKGDHWVLGLKYERAFKAYQQALNNLKPLKDPKSEIRLSQKMQITKQIITADSYISNENYQEALTMYTKSAAEGNSVGYEMSGLNAKITQTKQILDMLDLLKEGDECYNRQDFEVAKEKYQLALTIAEQLVWDGMKVEISAKIAKVDHAVEQIAKEKAAKELAAKQRLARERQRQLEKAKAKEIAKTSKKNFTSGTESKAEKGLRLENAGDEKYQAREYKAAIELYTKAKTVYVEKGLNGKAENVAAKIREVKRKRLQSLFTR